MNGFLLKIVVLLAGLTSSLAFATNSIPTSHRLPASFNDANQSIALDANKKTITSLGCMACHQRPSTKNNSNITH